MITLCLTNHESKLVDRALQKSIGALRKKPEHKELLKDYEKIRNKLKEEQDGQE